LLAVLHRWWSSHQAVCAPALSRTRSWYERYRRKKKCFTITIEAAHGVTTGVSAADRVTTVRAAIADGAKPSDLNRPGHVFPLRAQPGGVLTRGGHTEATIDLVTLAGFKPAGVLCELTNDDGSMARAPECIDFAVKHNMAVVTIEDLVAFRQAHERKAS
jgi:3,4-dihydroxy 2-butanone 4-phosphate synthase